MARVTEHRLHFSDVRLDVRCNSSRVNASLRRRWGGMRWPMVPVRKTYSVEVDAAKALRIVFDGELLWDGPLDETPENMFEVFLYRGMLAEHAKRFGVFHGGAVTSKRVTWVFCGPSRAGKSALTTAAVKRGCRYFTDEFVVTDGRVVWGWPRTPEVAVRASPAETRPVWLPEAEPADAHAKARYPLRRGQLAEGPAPASRVHFVRVEPGAKTRVDPMRSVEALRHWHEAAFHDTPVSLGSLVGSGRTWSATWRDPVELLEELENRIEHGRSVAHASGP